MTAIVDLIIGTGGSAVCLNNAESAHQLSVSVELDPTGAVYRVRGDKTLVKLSGPRAGKLRVNISGAGPYPPPLRSIDWAVPQTVQWVDLGVEKAKVTITAVSDGPREDQDIRAAQCRWSLDLRQV